MNRLGALMLAVVTTAWGAAVPAAQEFDATLHWGRRVELGLPVSGVVQEIYADRGQQVLAGQALVKLDPRGFEARLAGARGRLEAVLPALEEARQELARAEDLFDRTLLSEHDLELAGIEVATLEARLAQAEARVAMAALRLERSTLRAPFDGVVVARSVEVGQAIVSRMHSRTLMVVADDRNFIARAALPAGSVAALIIGQEVTVAAGGRDLKGTLAAIGPEPLPASGTEPRHEVDVLVPAPEDRGLRLGQRVTVRIP